jgi:hypothetical protein
VHFQPLIIKYTAMPRNYKEMTPTELKNEKERLAKHDLIWDAEKKEAVKLVWFPKDDETYYYPTFAPNSECMSAKTHNDGTNLDSSIIKLGLAFKTAKEATACANRMLNAAHNA